LDLAPNAIQVQAQPSFTAAAHGASGAHTAMGFPEGQSVLGWEVHKEDTTIILVPSE